MPRLTLILAVALLVGLYAPAALAEGAKPEEKGPIKIQRFEFSYPQLPQTQALNEVKGDVVVKNTGKEDVSGVRIVVHVQDGYHVDIDTIKQDVGVLKPNQEYTFNWTWRNYSNFYIDPLAEVIYRENLSREILQRGIKPRDLSVTRRATAGLPASAPGESSSSHSYEVVPTGSEIPTYSSPPEEGNPPGYGP